VIGFAVLWVILGGSGRLILGATMNVLCGLIRASALIGALLCAFAPYLIHRVERSPAARLLPRGSGLVGAISLLVS
jgi:hypothetical protein